MMRHPTSLICLASLVVSCVLPSFSAEQRVKIEIHWDKAIAVSKTSLSIQDCPEPPLRRGRPTHDPIYKALRDLHADYPRLQPWNSYPKIAVAELKPPEDGTTYWDFTIMDEITEDFMQATEGHPVVFCFSTIPAWMFRTKTPVAYPEDPDAIDWNYEQSTELRDPSMKEVADYFARLVGWYTQGGFNDEYGRWHASVHHYKVAYWEVLNEVDLGQNISPELYTRLYDSIVARVRQVAPDMKFMGPALGNIADGGAYLTYFLDPRNHQPGIPIDRVSYHLLAGLGWHDEAEIMPHLCFEQADHALTAVRYIESIRKLLSPQTGTDIDEMATVICPATGDDVKPIPDWYWNLSASISAYAYTQLALMGIDVVGINELIDYPGQFASETLTNWETGQPNARYWAWKLLRENFLPGDRLVETQLHFPARPIVSPYIYAQAFVTQQGERKVLLLSKRNRSFDISIPGAAGAKVEVVDQTTSSSPPGTTKLAADGMTLHGFAVAVVTYPRGAQ
jgi:hypothetical protein